MQRKVTPQASGNSHIVDFVPNRKVNTAPGIVESYVSDSGDIMHILDNGREQSENNYIHHWGRPKGDINLKAKNKGLDGRTNWIK